MTFDAPHRRWNLLRNRWILNSPQRLTRPWQGQIQETPSLDRVAYEPVCYLCPRNSRARGMRNPNYRDVFAFQNDYPALLLNRTSFVHFSDANDIIQARTERGVCRVLCYTARHDLTGATMDIPAIARVFDLWREEYQTLCVETEIVHVMIFENKGEMMGTSNPHPDGQIWATAHIPSFSCETSDSSSPHEQSRLYV